METDPLVTLTLQSDKGKLKGFYLFVRRDQYLKVAVPFCSNCAASQIRRSRIGRLLMIVAFIVGLGISSWLDLSRFQFLLLSGALCGPAYWLMHHKDRTVRIFSYDDETVTFSLKRTDYANAFLQANPRSKWHWASDEVCQP
jgi:hypothetical protein